MATCSRMELANTPARFLDKFIEDHLLPDTRFREQVREAVDIICTFLKERCFRGATHRVRVSKVVKGGSSGKGTALRGRSDADLVVFLTNLTSFHEQLEKRREFIREIRSQLKACQREKMFEVTFALTQRSNPRVLSFELRSLQRQQQVEFDVLPAFDALGHVTRGYRPRPQVYVDLIEECTALGKEGEFSTCFTELQRAFLKQRPTKLKSLIRLVKHWYQRCKERFVKKPLPPQYALELLTVYAWERGSGETEFNTARGFRTVLELVTRYQHLRIYWTVYYDFADPRVGRYLAQQLAKPRPVILDPADPTGNVATGNRKGWRRLAQEADAWLTLLCFQNWDGSRVSSWDVQGGSCGRGTALRGGSDCELVVFLDCFKSFEDQRAGRAEVLRELQALLDAWGREPGPGLKLESPVQATGGLLRFRLAAVDLENWMDVSLVPAFDALGQLGAGAKPEPQVYSALLGGGCQGGEHSACFAELRRSFVNMRPAKLKNLILLVKHWYRQVCPKEAGEGTLPPAYALELLTIFAWEQGCGKDAFSLAQGLRTVLGLIQSYQQLCVFWTVNYGFEDPAVSQFLRGQLKRPRPVILDPADPTWDVGNGTTWHWEVLALEAESCYHHPCFLQGTGDPVQPWEGPGLPRAGGSDLGHPIQRDPGQGTPEDGERLDAMHPGPPRPAPGPSEAAPGPSPSPSPAGLAMDLAQIPSKELDRFIQEHLKPSPRFQEQVKKAIDAILCCLREKCAHKVSRVSKGGSFGRGTDLRGGCDVELVIFLHCFTDFTAQGPSRAEVLAGMRTQLESWCREPGPGLTLKFPAQDGAKALRCRLESSTLEGCVDISLLPAFDAVGQLGAGAKPKPQVYSALLGSGCQGGEHAACFAELRRSFVNTRPVKLKNLILLVKHWYRRVAAQDTGKQPASASLPPAYALELLTIFAWEQGCGKDRFSMAEGLRTVLELVRQHQQLCVYWTLNYGIEDPAVRTHLLGQLRKPRPLILDPADPTWNVGQGNWELLAREVAALGTQACFTSGDGTAVQPWDVLPALLHQTPAADLDKFISEFLQPNRQFLAQVNKAVNAICSFLRENCFRNSPIKVLKVVKGGSSAKGTALRGRSDADLVVFLSCFGQFSEQGNRRAEVIAEIRAQLEACQQERQFEVKFEISKWENPRVLSFSLSSPTMLDQSVDFDVLPAFDALGQLVPGSRPSSQVYVDLIRSYSHAGEFSTCFTELQRDFIVSRPTKLKSLIRLVKYWYRQCNKMPKGRGSLPPQHGLELLTVYAWEQAGRDAQFSMAEGFRTVLELVSQYRQLRVYWTLNYDREDKTIRDFLELQLQKPRPIILDPADPTGNLGHSARWDLLAKEAATYMSSLCCMDRDGTPIQPWPVKAAV